MSATTRYSLLQLPSTYHVPAALILLAGGLLACFAGYRLFRFVLAIYGFILGAVFAVSYVTATTTAMTIAVAIIGGLVGAAILTFGYFLAVALLGAGLAALVAQTIWAQQGWGDPRPMILLAFAVGGAVVALVFQRYVIIIGTAFGGAWTAIVGALAMVGDTAARQAANAPSLRMFHPLHVPISRSWVTIAWLVLGLVGALVQMRRRAK